MQKLNPQLELCIRLWDFWREPRVTSEKIYTPAQDVAIAQSDDAEVSSSQPQQIKGENIVAMLQSAGIGINSQEQGEKLVNWIIEALIELLRKEERVGVQGLGTLVVKKRKAREGRNPQTGELIRIHASKTVFFRPGKGLKNFIQAKKDPHLLRLGIPKDLVNVLVSTSTFGVSHDKVKMYARMFFEALARELKAKDKVLLWNFGSFNIKRRPARHGRNPMTGQRITILGSTTVVFKPARYLKEQI